MNRVSVLTRAAPHLQEIHSSYKRLVNRMAGQTTPQLCLLCLQAMPENSSDLHFCMRAMHGNYKLGVRAIGIVTRTLCLNDVDLVWLQGQRGEWGGRAHGHAPCFPCSVAMPLWDRSQAHLAAS